jgi:anaerobic ribonucleoside-triphosphate reductase
MVEDNNESRRSNLAFVFQEEETVGLHHRLATKMFRLVQKRDGKIVEFNKDKISAAIFKAARSVGGEDIEIAEFLSDEVVLYLYSQRGDHIPHVEEIQDAVEKVLIERGHAKTAKAYILYRDQRARLRRKRAFSQQISKKAREEKDTTDLALFVKTTDFETPHGPNLVLWDRERIVDALVRETDIAPEVAQKISHEVEDEILSFRVKTITSSLIRELVDAKLIEHGLVEVYKRHARLGVPLYDVERVLLFQNRENANIPHNPEATNMTLAEAINKQFGLTRVFDEQIADAHIRGDIHLHDLGFINRPYCSGQSLEYVKKFGLNLPNALSIARPAKHPETLLAHIVKFSAALQGHFAGAIGWDAVNVFFAPFLIGMSDYELHQIAQMMIFEYSQQSVARGGQAIFSDLNLYWEVPKHFEKVPAIGPGGEYTGKTYGDYIADSQKFAWALFDIYNEGDGLGRPFFFPKPLVHITDTSLRTPGFHDFLHHICDVAAEKGNTYFVFDRGDTAKVSECCRLSFKLDESDLEDAQYPWKMRYSAIQNVTLNLPRIAFEAAGDTEKLFSRITELFRLAVKAHTQKREFINSLLELKEEGPLALLTMEKDGEHYLRMHRATFLIGILGLNEMIQAHTGHELHESREALRLGLRVISHMKLLCDRYSRETGLRLVLEQTPAESAAYRLAKLDLEQYPQDTIRVVKGNIETEEVYYTNSTYINVSVPINPIDRVTQEGLFHPLIEAGALSHVWIADARPPAESVANFVLKTFQHTQNAQIAFSPEFTTCNDCGKTSRGLADCCPYCHSENVDGITRVTGYFTRISSWNKGKKGELRDRYRSREHF